MFLAEADRQKARWKLADVYRSAILREPLELIAYIVRNDRPFTELATADYIMVSPYTARGYGMFDEVKSQFKNVEDPFEYIPAKLKALRPSRRPPKARGRHPPDGESRLDRSARHAPLDQSPLRATALQHRASARGASRAASCAFDRKRRR